MGFFLLKVGPAPLEKFSGSAPALYTCLSDVHIRIQHTATYTLSLYKESFEEREIERKRERGVHEFFGSGSTSFNPFTYTFLIFNIKECHEHIRTDRWSTILKDISMFFRATSLLRSTSPSLRKLRFSCLSVSSFLQAPLRLVNYAAGLVCDCVRHDECKTTCKKLC